MKNAEIDFAGSERSFQRWGVHLREFDGNIRESIPIKPHGLGKSAVEGYHRKPEPEPADLTTDGSQCLCLCLGGVGHRRTRGLEERCTGCRELHMASISLQKRRSNLVLKCSNALT